MSSTLFEKSSWRPGLFVTVDGPNASGKTTIAEGLADRLARDGVNVHATRQPSTSAIGELARGSEAVIGGRALACLVAADRHHQLRDEIVPALEAGAVVLCDRYVESSLVLQRIDEVELDYILAINEGIERPGIRVRLETTEPVLQQRRMIRATQPGRRFENMADGAARELRLYAEAESVLVEDCLAPEALVLDTTSSTAGSHADMLANVVIQRLRERQQ